MVKIYACKKATKTSIRVIKNDNTKERPVAPTTPKLFFNVNMIAIKLITTICPAEMLANKRTNNEKGLMINAPANSMTAKTGLIRIGTPGIHNMCIQ